MNDAIATQKADQAIYDDKVRDHKNKVAATGQATGYQSAALNRANSTLGETQAACTASQDRQMKAAVAAEAADSGFLQSTQNFVSSLDGKLSSFQGASMLLSLGERMKLNSVSNQLRVRGGPC